jgi:hypothetical protein
MLQLSQNFSIKAVRFLNNSAISLNIMFTTTSPSSNKTSSCGMRWVRRSEESLELVEVSMVLS